MPPDPKPEVPFIDFSPLQNALAGLEKSALAFQNGEKNPAIANEILLKMEQFLTREEGLPGRPWFKHQIYAPGFYTGYGVKTLPGVREALEEYNWNLAQDQIKILAGVLDEFSMKVQECIK